MGGTGIGEGGGSVGRGDVIVGEVGGGTGGSTSSGFDVGGVFCDVGNKEGVRDGTLGVVGELSVTKGAVSFL